MQTTMGSMAKIWPLALLLLTLLPFSATTTTKKTYIVHMNHHAKPESHPTHHEWYTAKVQSLTSSSAAGSLLYTYTNAFHGFAATLHPDQVEVLRRSEHVIGVHEDQIYHPATTRTPQFLGLDTNFGLIYRGSNSTVDIGKASEDIIIGLLDTGVWPESKSFDDTGMSSIPKRWKGKCVSAPDFDPAKHCSNKIIGARYFSQAYHASRPQPWDVDSPRDLEGHGTHTASTAAGSPVANVSFYGLANGTARGMASNARLAIYKVCWLNVGCHGGDILAGLDAAILDGVDVLSLSISTNDQLPYHEDPIAMGAFAAMEQGIFVSAGAGNDGPARSTLRNQAPWILTVGAGTLDRTFPGYVQLGNNRRFTGISIYSGQGMGNLPVGLVHFDENNNTRVCFPGSLRPELVQRKVVICDKGEFNEAQKGLVVREAGGVGVILVNKEDVIDLTSDAHLVPTVGVGRRIGVLIKRYAKNDSNPKALLTFGSTMVNVRPSPVVASFSARGPNNLTPEILKPDVIAPGVNILAAWTGAAGPTPLAADSRRPSYSMMYGTSMSCPHVSGIAALLKAAHPDWSVSAIKSALMTTAYTVDNSNSPILDSVTGEASNPWAYGSGHVDPSKALNPGLVYDISTEDYMAFLCSLKLNISDIQIITNRPNITCTRRYNDPGDLNYPSFSILFGNRKVVRYTREVTNVGEAASEYNVAVNAPSTVLVTTNPTKLVFKNAGEKQSYTVTFESRRNANSSITSGFGSIIWSNSQHRVSSPIAFMWA